MFSTFNTPLLHDLRFQKEKEKEKERPKIGQSLLKQKDLGSNSGDHSKFDPLLYFHFWWIRLLFCHSCPVLAKSRTEHVTGIPLIRLLYN